MQTLRGQLLGWRFWANAKRAASEKDSSRKSDGKIATQE
jgi:hypothetical protein